MPCPAGGRPVTIETLFGFVKDGSCDRPMAYVAPFASDAASDGMRPRESASSR